MDLAAIKMPRFSGLVYHEQRLRKVRNATMISSPHRMGLARLLGTFTGASLTWTRIELSSMCLKCKDTSQSRDPASTCICSSIHCPQIPSSKR